MTYKTKTTGGGRQWIHTKLERITNNATFAAGGQCDQSDLGSFQGLQRELFPVLFKEFLKSKSTWRESF